MIKEILAFIAGAFLIIYFLFNVIGVICDIDSLVNKEKDDESDV